MKYIKKITIGILMVVMLLMTIIGATAFTDTPEYYYDCEGNLDNTGIQTGFSLNNTGVTFTPSLIGQACSFGANDFASNSSFGNLTATFTIELWVNASSLTNDQIVLEISDGSDANRLSINWDNGNNQYVTNLRRASGSSWELIGATNFVQNAYAHVVVMRNLTGTFQFHNGTLVASQTANNDWFTNDAYPILTLGGRIGTSSLDFIGDVEQLAFFNRSFNVDDIIFGFNNGIPINYNLPPENHTLTSPSDSSSALSPINFSFTIGSGTFTTATLFHNNSGVFVSNGTISSPTDTFVDVPLLDGETVWNVEVNFTTKGETFAEENFTVNILIPAENHTLTSPSDGLSVLSPINFSFTLLAGNYTTATLFHNNSGVFVSNLTATSPNTTFIGVPLLDGETVWNVEVNFISSGLTFAEENFTVTIVSLPEEAFENFRCPVDDIPQALIFMIIVVLSAFIIIVGFAFGSPLIGTFGGFMLILLGFVIVGCQQSLGMLTFVAGFFIIVKFLFGSTRNNHGADFV